MPWRHVMGLVVNMYYVYILLLKTKRLYTGSTNDLRRRYKEHQQNQVLSTKNKVDKLIFYEAYIHESDARRREKYLKTSEGKTFLRKQIKDVLAEYNIGEIA
jgi:putative endonuclease